MEEISSMVEQLFQNSKTGVVCFLPTFFPIKSRSFFYIIENMIPLICFEEINLNMYCALLVRLVVTLIEAVTECSKVLNIIF